MPIVLMLSTPGRLLRSGRFPNHDTIEIRHFLKGFFKGMHDGENEQT